MRVISVGSDSFFCVRLCVYAVSMCLQFVCVCVCVKFVSVSVSVVVCVCVCVCVVMCVYSMSFVVVCVYLYLLMCVCMSKRCRVPGGLWKCYGYLFFSIALC